jgi:thiol-disulfide isomerase/thioredoxin
VTPLQNSSFRDEKLVSDFQNRILFKEFFLSRQLFDGGCKNAKFHVFIGCKEDEIFIGFDKNNNLKFESKEITAMPSSKKRVVTIKILPKNYCDTNVLLDSSIVHLIPFRNQVSYNDISATDTMLQLSMSRGYIKEFQLNDTSVLLSHTPTFRKDDSSLVSSYILKSPKGLTAIYPQKDLLNFGGVSYDIQKTINKDELILVAVDGASAIKIKQVNKILIDSLMLINLNTKKKADIAFNKDFILIDFWATWCKPCISSMPLLAKLNEKEKKRLQIISICADAEDNINKAQKIVKNYKLKYSQFFFKNDPYAPDLLLYKFGLIFYPTYILLDRNGKVLQHTSDLKSIRF